MILGGRGPTGFLSTAEIFDPATGTFAPTTPGLMTPSADHTATLLPFGEVLIAGGENTTGTLSATSLYDPKLVDTSSPAVAALSLSAGSTDVDLTEVIGIRFSEPVDITTLTGVNISLTGGGLPADVTISTSEDLLVFIVPTTKLTAGTTYTLSLSPAITDTAGNALVPFSSTFTTVAAPVITAVTPDHGPAGQAVMITGQNFDASAPSLNVVSFGEIEAFVTLATATLLEVSVPSGAPLGAGTVTVKTRGGTASAPFTVDNLGPTIQSFTPNSGPVGTLVTITGLNFDPVASNNQLSFNGTSAVIAAATTTEITTTVPQGATTGPITLTTPTGTATSTPFTVVLSQDFSLNLLPATAGLVAGSHRFISIGATGINGFTDWISLSTNPLPTGISMLFLPPQVTPGGLASVEILANATTVPGTYPVTFIGTAQIDGQTIIRTAAFSLQVLAGGTTTLSGQVLNTDNNPIPGVTVSLGTSITTTDEAGRFFLDNALAGQQVILVDGRTATAPSTFYPEVEAVTDILAGVGNVLPFIIYLPEIDTAHPIDLPVDATGTTTVAVQATTPLIPGLEVNIPAGTQIIDPNGNPVSQITITPVPPDRAPMPLPPGIDAPLLFTIQPGESPNMATMPKTG